MTDTAPVVVAHCMPVYDTVEFGGHESVLSFALDFDRVAPAHWRLKGPLSVRGQPVSHVRNLLVSVALADHGPARRTGTGEPADVVLFQDSDCQPESPLHYVRLVQTLLELPLEYGVVGSPVLVQAADGAPRHNVNMNGMAHEMDPARPFECAGIGFGLVAVRAAVFHGTERPWFSFGTSPDGTLRGEDIGFTDRARLHGWRVACEPRAEVRHNFRRSFSIRDVGGIWFRASR